MNTSLMFSQQTDEWTTPQWLFDELNREFSFVIDLAATRENAKCRVFYTKEPQHNALTQRWHTFNGAPDFVIRRTRAVCRSCSSRRRPRSG